MKKKLLYILTQSEWGGAQKYVYDLVDNLPKDSFTITVASGQSASSELRNKLTARHIATHPLKAVQRSINPLRDIAAIIEIYRLCKKLQPDIIHLNSSKVSIVGSIAAKLAGVPRIIYTAHGWVFNEPNRWYKNLFYLLAEFLTARLKDDIICVSEFDRQTAIKKYLLPKRSLVTIHNGINVNALEFYDTRTAREILSEKIKHELPHNLKIIGTIGNLYETKGHRYLIEAMKDVPDALCIIIGEGPQRESLEQLLRKLQLTERVLLPGGIPNAYQFLKAFDTFVLPSVKEGFPYIILEAVAAHIPLVATRVGGIPELLPREFLINPGDTNALITSLTKTQQHPSISKDAISLSTMIQKTQLLYK